jgi:hypothetical protein
MGTHYYSRLKRRRRLDAVSRRARKALIAPVALICIIAIAGGLLALRQKGPDLFDLTPRFADLDGYTLVAWYDLERGHRTLRSGGLSAGTATRILGYMMNGNLPVRDGQLIESFVLLPDAGSPVHPAHRFGDQMIEVRLRTGDAVPFSEGNLVWVSGAWTILSGDPSGPTPLYVLGNAQVKRADKSDISKYFR